MKAGKIIQSSGKSVENKSYPGLFECVLEHKVSETGANFQWSGPKLTPEIWREILAFFQWTYKEHASEAQVRLFVHPEKGWLAWAFPQKGGTSLTTKEVENEESKKQRAEQIPNGYVAFGTVHHHCSLGAFQSMTDTDDEKDVDGLHITVGQMDKPEFNMHARLYLKGNKFEPDMSAFWDIGQEFIEKILFVADLGFGISELTDRTARKQMCAPAPADTLFPKLWVDNYLIEKPAVQTYNGPGRYGGRYEWQAGSIVHNPGLNGHSVHGTQGVIPNTAPKRETKSERRARKKAERENNSKLSVSDVLNDILLLCDTNYTTKDELDRILNFLANDREFKMIQEIADKCAENKFSFDDLHIEFQRQLDEAEKEGLQSLNGIPPTQDEIARQVAEGGMGFGYGMD